MDRPEPGREKGGPMNTFLGKGAGPSKTDQAYSTLREQIIGNVLKPGMPLVERKLCQYLSSSRTPVREALHRLRNEGLVAFGPGQGAYVAPISYEHIQETYDIREVLEGLAARLCAQNLDEGRVRELEGILRGLEEAKERGDYDALLEMDIGFHQFIIRESRSQHLITLLMAIFNHSKRITNLTRNDQSRATETLAQHTLLFEAIRKGDQRGAEEAMRAHIRNSRDYHLANINRYKILA